VLFVNDGSTDETGSALAQLADASESTSILELSVNSGKAEAVRQGLLVAIARGAPIVGYYDADLATPPDELLRLLSVLEKESELSAVFGARVARLGSHIERSSTRHYAGRVFASIASVALGVTVYDTQCGAKVFRVTPALTAALAEPFRSSWGFDVLLCHRLLAGTDCVTGLPLESFREVPLDSWRAVEGSKLRLSSATMALVDVVAIGLARLRSRHVSRTVTMQEPCPLPTIERAVGSGSATGFDMEKTATDTKSLRDDEPSGSERKRPTTH
jgi:glycosyltransferase involved in cell wall biosynthesis